MLANSKVAARIAALRAAADKAVIKHIVYDKEAAMEEADRAMHLAEALAQIVLSPHTRR